MLPRTSGGGRAYVENLREVLSSHPLVEEIVAFQMGGMTSQSARIPDAVVLDVPESQVLRRVRGPDLLRKALMNHPIDVMLAPGTEVTRVSDVPTVMMPLTVAPYEPSALAVLSSSPAERARWQLRRRSIAAAARNAEALCFSSHYTRALYLEKVPALRDKRSVVIPPAHTLPTGDRSTQERVIAEPYLLFVSHLYPYKMVAALIDGYVRAQREGGLPHHLVIAGGWEGFPSYGAEMRRLAAESGVGDRIHFLGEVTSDELPSLYAAADLFIFPSISENAGSFALLDAFLMGTPVLSSSMSSMPEACQDAVRYFDPREPEQLASQILQILGDPTLRADLARRSAERGKTIPTWNEVGARLTQFLFDVVHAGRRDE